MKPRRLSLRRIATAVYANFGIGRKKNWLKIHRDHIVFWCRCDSGQMEKYMTLEWKTYTSHISEYCRDSRSIASFDTYGVARRTVSHTFGVSIAFLAYLCQFIGAFRERTNAISMILPWKLRLFIDCQYSSHCVVSKCRVTCCYHLTIYLVDGYFQVWE